MEKYYIYSHTRKDTGQCFYIGMGKGGRAYQRYRGARNRHWAFIAEKGYNIRILVNGLTQEKAWEIEKNFISQIGIENLAQYQEGGKGGFSNEIRAKALTPEARKKAYNSIDWDNHGSIKTTDKHKYYNFKNGHASIPVEGTHRGTGKKVIARNMTEAAKLINGTLGGVSAVINGQLKSHRNYTFKTL